MSTTHRPTAHHGPGLTGPEGLKSGYPIIKEDAIALPVKCAHANVTLKILKDQGRLGH